MYRPVIIRDEVTLVDEFGNKLFTVDRWIYEVAVKRGDLKKWLGAEAHKH